MFIVEKVYILMPQINTFFLSELSLLSYSFVGVGKFHDLEQRFLYSWTKFSLPAAYGIISGNVSVTGTNAYPSFATVLQYPALNTLGISHVRLDFGIGGVVPPHTHPFSSETLFVVQGSIYTGFISFDGVLYAETLQQGDIYIFPKGTLHFQINVGTGPAISFNSLNSQSPGFLVAANQLLLSNIPAAVLESSLGISNATDLNLLEASVPPFWG